jgi:hypothetical protein
MPNVSPQILTERTNVLLNPEQREWLNKKSHEETCRRGKDVPMCVIIRALIQRQMDYEEEGKKAQDV